MKREEVFRAQAATDSKGTEQVQEAMIREKSMALNPTTAGLSAFREEEKGRRGRNYALKALVRRPATAE